MVPRSKEQTRFKIIHIDNGPAQRPHAARRCQRAKGAVKRGDKLSCHQSDLAVRGEMGVALKRSPLLSATFPALAKLSFSVDCEEVCVCVCMLPLLLLT